MPEHSVRRAPIRQVEAPARELALERVLLSQPAIGPFCGESRGYRRRP